MTARRGPVRGWTRIFHEAPMNIFSNTVVSITFKLTTRRMRCSINPELSLSARRPLGIFQGEEALNHKAVGDNVIVTLEPADAS